MTVTAHQTSRTHFSVGNDIVCTAEPGRVIVSIGMLKSMAEFEDWISALKQAVEAAQLPPVKPAEPENKDLRELLDRAKGKEEEEG
jgi:hypothetical protein